MTSDQVRKAITRIGTMTSRPEAFLILIGYAALWLMFDRKSFDWHGVATLATWAMTLFIQRAEHRDTQAIHAKLDELVRAAGKADNDVVTIDDEEPEEIEDHREREQGAG